VDSAPKRNPKPYLSFPPPAAGGAAKLGHRRLDLEHRRRPDIGGATGARPTTRLDPATSSFTAATFFFDLVFLPEI